MGCEGSDGPAGPAGANGQDGMDGANGTSVAVCMDCHTDAGSLQIYLEYAQSHHQDGLYVGYAGGRQSCARCHSKQGYIEYAVTGSVAEDVSYPAAIDCATCHVVHPEEWALRLTGPVTWIADVGYGDTTVDFADNSNTCAECHQSRRNEPNITDPGDTFEITSTHYGPHHGAMANVLEGVLFAEIPGSIAYPTSSMHVSAGATCVTCHMETYTAGDSDAAPETTSAGGHTMWPNLDNCQGCHATADFNYGNVQADTQVLLDNLRDILVDLGVLEYVEEDEAYEPIVGTYPMVEAQAFFNWIGLTEDRSLGVHNPRYVEALLTNSIEANTPETP
jgi:formate-dependent nitrite reductase cytochrome c552 subunit